MGALGTLLNSTIDHFAQVNLGGFVRVVDTLGGIDVDVADGFCDPTYDEYGFTAGFAISAGRHHLNGNQALAFARVRKAAGESDFTRAARQQEVLSGIRDAVSPAASCATRSGLCRRSARPSRRTCRATSCRASRTLPAGSGGPDLSGGHHPSARPVGLRLARLDPAARHRGDPGACRRCSPTSGVIPPAKYRVPASTGRVSGSGVRHLRPATDAPTEPRATPSADRAAPADADADADADAQAERPRNPRATAAPTPTPTAAPTPTPTPTPAAAETLIARTPAATTATSHGPGRGARVEIRCLARPDTATWFSVNVHPRPPKGQSHGGASVEPKRPMVGVARLSHVLRPPGERVPPLRVAAADGDPLASRLNTEWLPGAERPPREELDDPLALFKKHHDGRGAAVLPAPPPVRQA